MSTNYKELCLNYFTAWSNRDINALSKLFASDIMLMDWEMNASGLFDVLAANQKIFDSVTSLRVDTSEMVQEPNKFVQKVVCVISIWINEGTDNQQIIPVIDIINFNDEDKIDLIRAYRGF
jgi:ketosteroid isomerase-like protein